MAVPLDAVPVEASRVRDVLGLVGREHHLELGTSPVEPAPVAHHDAFVNGVNLFAAAPPVGKTASSVSLGLRGRVADTSGPADSPLAPLPLHFMSRRTTVTSGTLLTLVAPMVIIFP
jgi:hypothetical protein